jgi:uncharacterized membrane protein
MLRKALRKFNSGREPVFKQRGHEVQRIETFSDAVFAFAVTLLIVSLEVPKSFDELMISIRGFYAFAISFLLLTLIWYEQHAFFRRFGLADTPTIALNIALNFVVLFYVYPLKFLFTYSFRDQIYGNSALKPVIKEGQGPALMMIYGIGFMCIYFLLFAMYFHALQKKGELQLTRLEEYDTRTKMFANLIFMAIGLLSITMAYLSSGAVGDYAGMVYLLIFPVITLFYTYRGRKKRRLNFS